MTTVTPTGQVVPTATGRDLVLERTLPGSIDDAWASITESDRLARWFCTWTGCEPPTHLAVTTQDEAGTWRLEATLTPVDADHTRLRFVHHLEDGDNASEVGPGWEYYLATLESAMAGGPRPEWDDYWPRLSAAYA